MELANRVQDLFQKYLENEVFKRITDRYGISAEELAKCVNVSNQVFECNHVFTKGVRINQQCLNKAVDSDRKCARHKNQKKHVAATSCSNETPRSALNVEEVRTQLLSTSLNLEDSSEEDESYF
jgi:hypothetical protein